jgi:NAD-dependent dihydropyrimidine dehydrogenase PreA subunit
MIEIINKNKCTKCNICVKICPLNVFDFVKGETPTIARQFDCQTCFMCEAYCPTDAIYVFPNTDPVNNLKEEDLTFGTYKSSLGWSDGQSSTASSDSSDKIKLV